MEEDLEERKQHNMVMKQKYLRENIIEQGYDGESFCNFLSGKKEDGTDINNWELLELIQQVQVFKYQTD